MTQHKFSGLTFLMADWSTYMFIRSSIEGRTLALMTMSASATFFDLNSDVFSFAAHISIVMFKSPRPGVSRIVNWSVFMASKDWVHDYGLLLVLKPSLPARRFNIVLLPVPRVPMASTMGFVD